MNFQTRSTPEYQSFDYYYAHHTPKEQMQKWDSLIAQSQITFKQLSTYTTQSPALPEVQEIVKKWQNYISENFYPCSKQMLTYLGQLYLCDQRFKTYIDRFGNDTSAFFNQAIKHYCSNTQPIPNPPPKYQSPTAPHPTLRGKG